MFTGNWACDETDALTQTRFLNDEKKQKIRDLRHLISVITAWNFVIYK
jgi:hypothetical protein